ncbi:MAG: BMP family ABC transporter substrate-binding protein [Eubacteriales bacterium]
MRKLLVVMIMLVFVVSGLAGCAKDAGYKIAMITDAGEIDDKSFNQGTWEGIEKFAKENDKTYKYYKPTEVSDDAYLAAIDLAIEGGAEVVVTPGFLFEPAIYEAQDLYPDTSFIILDGTPHTPDYSTFRIESNVYSIFYAEQQSGFLAGYAAVKDGYTKLGFMGGMAVPAVVRFGYGFVQGAEYAAQEMGLESVEIKYHYTGDFAATPKNQTTAATWYADGTEVIFACGGKVGNSVMAAAEAAGAKVIGVDVDQSAESETVITSAKKELGVSVYAGLESYYAEDFKGGVSEVLDITVDGVGLPFATSRFETFTEDDYNAIYDALVADTDGIRTSILADTDVEAATDIPTEIVAVTIVE